MNISDEIAAAGLSPTLLHTFEKALHRVAAADGRAGEDEQATIRRLMLHCGPTTSPEEPLEGLWMHAELFIRACVEVALADGQYSVEEARLVSGMAHRLGVSTHRLAALESEVFAATGTASLLELPHQRRSPR